MNKCRPFLKWVGGKAKLIEQFKKYYPAELVNGKLNYAEPFLGGGAHFLYVAENFNVQKIYLSDINKDLILTYIVLRQNPQKLIAALKKYQTIYTNTEIDKRKDLFLSVRKNFNQAQTQSQAQTQTLHITGITETNNNASIARAAEFIFLNKTCYNGLWRLNLKSEFNVPFGRYKDLSLFDEENIFAVSAILQNADIVHADYAECEDFISNDTFVYFDPPYRPISKTSGFTSYSKCGFDDADQLQLASFFKKLDNEKGAKLFLSNSDPSNINPADDFFIKAYKGFNIYSVSASRCVNSNAAKRGKIKELLITNINV